MKAEKWLLGLDCLIGFTLLGFILFIDAGNFFLRVFLVAVYFFMAIPSLFTSKSLSLGLAPAYRHKAGSYRQKLCLGIDFLIRFSLLSLLLISFFFPKLFEDAGFSLLLIYLTYWNLARIGRHEVRRWK